MFGIRFIKVQPSTHVLQYRGGKIVREGSGLSFFYYGPTTSLVAVPVGSNDAPFIFQETTADFQTVTLQGQVTYRVSDLGKIIPEVFARRRPTKSVTMAKATLNNAQSMYAVNDLFIGPKSHGSARYVIHSGEATETHSSSGVIISTGMGSTGWLKSLLTGAAAITQSAGSVLAQRAVAKLPARAGPGSQASRRLQLNV